MCKRIILSIVLLASFSVSYAGAGRDKIITDNIGLMKRVITYASKLLLASKVDAKNIAKKKKLVEGIVKVAKEASKSCTIL